MYIFTVFYLFPFDSHFSWIEKTSIMLTYVYYNSSNTKSEMIRVIRLYVHIDEEERPSLYVHIDEEERPSQMIFFQS